ncbi:MAG: class I SAM-dependent DNA methyltransferase [Promethearchaeota archaeon]
MKSNPDDLPQIFRNIINSLSLKLPSQLISYSLFSSELGTPIESEKERNNALKTSAAYLLIAQITFYLVLSEKRADLPKINTNSLKNSEVLANYFEKALEVTSDPIFKQNLLKNLDAYSFKFLKDIIKIIMGLKPELLQYEILVLIFNSLIPPSLRKKIGAYYSGMKTAYILSYYAIDNPSVTILDPACGSGALLVSSYKRKKELLILKKGKFTIEDHKRFLSSDITGLDIMPFAVHLSATHLALQAPIWGIRQNRLAICDSAFVDPKSKIRRISGKKENIFSIKFTKQLHLDFVDLVIMNPPFVRHENLNKIRKSYKNELRQVFYKYSFLIDKRTSYYCYFLLLADKFLRSGGKIAAIIPASFLRINTTYKIRKWLMEQYDIQYIICQQDKPNFSENTAFREVLLIATKNQRTTRIIYIIVKDQESTDFLGKEWNGGISDSWKIRIVPREELSPNNLFLPIAATHQSDLLKTWNQISDQKTMISFNMFLKARKACFKRGIETSKGFKIQTMVINEFNPNYLRSMDNWIFNGETDTHIYAIDRNSNLRIKIPKDCLIPHLRRMTGENRLDTSNKKEFVIISSFPQLKDFLVEGRMINEKLTSTKLKKWKLYVEERITNLMIARRFDLSASGTFLFSFFSREKRAPPGVMWSILDLSIEEAKILCLYFNSIINILQIFLNRVETRGTWMQLHEYVIEELKLPNILTWTAENKFPYYQLFDEIKDEIFPPLWQQLAMNIPISEIRIQDYDLLKVQFPEFEKFVGKKFKPRKRLDLLVLDTLGLKSLDEYEVFLQEIYLSLLLEIAYLKKMMK